MCDPIMSGEIYRFTYIRTHTETPMKRPWEGNNIFSFMLQELVDGNLGILEQTRAEHSCDVMKQIRDVPHFHRQVVLEYLFQPISVFLGSWDTVPLFWGPLMMVIDTVKVVVFVVPTESCEKGTIIHPRYVDTVDANLDVTKNTFWGPGDVVCIPPSFLVVLLSSKLRFR